MCKVFQYWASRKAAGSSLKAAKCIQIYRCKHISSGKSKNRKKLMKKMIDLLHKAINQNVVQDI